MVRPKDKPSLKRKSKDSKQRNCFLKTDSQLGKPRRYSTSEEFPDDNPLLSSQSNPNSGIAMSHTPKQNDEDIQLLLRKLGKSPSTAWLTNPAIMKSPEKTQQNKKNKIQHHEPKNNKIQMDIDSDLYKINQTEKDANNCLRIEKMTVK
ncbi:hypothetical protein AVEN_199618-1 [Araneus ventricosus]|uniref:Uncharacterized protein n=1 Tax=Araneus ventricosus TaxID=182803 RepID=A0A4Y2DHM3_ARAVE|nr:hypothetical protein AVEN_199618-1 [Araneus ventricosus]